MLKYTEDFLEMLGLAKNDLFPDISTLISISTIVDRVLKLFWILVVKENNIFADSLLGTTI